MPIAIQDRSATDAEEDAFNIRPGARLCASIPQADGGDIIGQVDTGRALVYFRRRAPGLGARVPAGAEGGPRADAPPTPPEYDPYVNDNLGSWLNDIR